MWNMSQSGLLMIVSMFVMAVVQTFFQNELGEILPIYIQKLVSYFNPYIQITFPEYQTGDFIRSKAYVAIEQYLSTNSANRARRLKANVVHNSKPIILTMDDREEVTDELKGIKVWWSYRKTTPEKQSLYSNYDDDEKRYYKLTCLRKHRDYITKVYLHHVLDEGEVIATKSRQRKLYTNSKSDYSGRVLWTYIMFDHPSTFDTLAMDPKKKKDILNDLITFSKSKDYYKKVGKSWKRGYLLYGPPGTGKSSMIAAMANLLHYDIYDLELTSVKNNIELKKLLIDTSSKSIIVIEDIDCSLDIAGLRKEKKKKNNNDENKKDLVIAKKDKKKKKKNENESEVTLSGLLNFIDGLWSACGSERLIVFTTNHVEKLDPALIRRGRMDMHIELSYCCFEAFKVLAKNYLDLESHELFATIGRLLEETNMTPADVAENLMPKSPEENGEICLNNLIKSLENKKELARLKAEEDARKKSEENGGNVQDSDKESSDEEESD